MDCSKCTSKATQVCSCLSVPMAYCSSCMISHITSSLSLQHSIQDIESKYASQLCSECDFRFSEVFCLCLRVGVCKGCLASHISSPGSHYIDYIKTEKQSKDTFELDRKPPVDNLKNEVIENITQLEDFIEKVRQSREMLHANIDRVTSDLLSNAESSKKKLEVALEMIKSSRVPKEDQWPYTYKKRQGAMTPSRRTMSINLKLCETELNIDSVVKAIANMGRVVLNGDVPQSQEQNLYVFKPKLKELACVDTASFYVVKKILPRNLILPESGSWCEGPSKQLIFVGGYTNKGFSNEVMLIDPISLNFRTIPSMKTPRAMSAIFYYNNELFVFGGYNGTNMNLCEKFNFVNNRWVDLPPMPIARSAFNIAESGGILYMSGDSKRLDAFNPVTSTYVENEAILTEASYSSLVNFKDTLILIQNESVYSIDLNNFSVKKIANAPSGKWWSSFPPYINSNFIVLSRADDGHLWMFDTASGSLTKKLKIS